MHEWALAEAIIDAALEAAEKESFTEITEVTIKVGELQQIEHDILRFALSHLKTEKFRKTKFRIETEKAQLKCRACGNSWAFNKKKLGENASEAIHFVPEVAHTYVNCPKCGSPDFEILEGRGILIQSVKGVEKS
jgi:hydrogenase nickel incorporation protein HypA/HybF